MSSLTLIVVAVIVGGAVAAAIVGTLRGRARLRAEGRLPPDGAPPLPMSRALWFASALVLVSVAAFVTGLGLLLVASFDDAIGGAHGYDVVWVAAGLMVPAALTLRVAVHVMRRTRNTGLEPPAT